MSNEKLSRKERLKKRQFSNKGQGRKKILQLPEDVKLLELEIEETTTVDFVPFPVDKRHPQYAEIKKDVEEYGEERLVDWKFEYAVHKGIKGLPEVICHQYTYGKACPVCEAKRTRMEEEGLEWDDKKLNEYSYSRRTAYLVAEVDADDDAYKVLDYPSGWLQKTLEEKGSKENIIFLDESAEGHSVRLTPVEHEFDGKKMPGKCMVKFKPRKYGFTEEDLDAAFNIIDFFNIQSYDEIYELFHGLGDETDSKATEIENSKPETRRMDRKAYSIVKASDVEEDDDFEEEEEKSKPETPSRRRGRGVENTTKPETSSARRRRAPVTESDDDEDDPTF